MTTITVTLTFPAGADPYSADDIRKCLQNDVNNDNPVDIGTTVRIHRLTAFSVTEQEI